MADEARLDMDRASPRFSMLVREGAASAMARLVSDVGARGEKCLLVTDGKVLPLHGRIVPAGVQVVAVGQGEEHKTLDGVECICRAALEGGITRDGLFIALGGGVVCDMTAFAASIWMRGTGCALFPTTLLAMCDAGLGGKNGVNLDGRKNLLGCIRPETPSFVDVGFCSTLDRRDMACGLAEAVKMAALYDGALLDFIEAYPDGLLAGDGMALMRVVQRCLELKNWVVEQDPFERGIRRQLNLGHTLGHAIETASRGAMKHGECVALGMILACRWSVERGTMKTGDVHRLERILGRVGLPPLSCLKNMDRDAVAGALSADKKRTGDAIRFVTLGGLGGKDFVRIEKVPLDILRRWLRSTWDTLEA